MGLYKKLDLWSIIDDLDSMMDYDYNGNEKESPYWDYYSEQIRELCILASDMWQEIQELKSKLWYKLPERKIAFCDEDTCEQTAIAWFNTAAAMLSDTDMQELLEHENLYNADLLEEKAKRITALSRLTKEQQLFLYSEVIGFITRYLELSAAFHTITAVINELDYHQTFVIKDNKIILPNEAYL